MKNNYSLWVRYSLIVSLFVISNLRTEAQSKNEVEASVLRIKVTEEFARELESGRKNLRTADGQVRVGRPSFDGVSKKFRTNNLRRVFRDGGKFEVKHRKYGLHLWYE